MLLPVAAGPRADVCGDRWSGETPHTRQCSSRPPHRPLTSPAVPGKWGRWSNHSAALANAGHAVRFPLRQPDSIHEIEDHLAESRTETVARAAARPADLAFAAVPRLPTYTLPA